MRVVLLTLALLACAVAADPKTVINVPATGVKWQDVELGPDGAVLASGAGAPGTNKYHVGRFSNGNEVHYEVPVLHTSYPSVGRDLGINHGNTKEGVVGSRSSTLTHSFQLPTDSTPAGVLAEGSMHVAINDQATATCELGHTENRYVAGIAGAAKDGVYVARAPYPHATSYSALFGTLYNVDKASVRVYPADYGWDTFYDNSLGPGTRWPAIANNMDEEYVLCAGPTQRGTGDMQSHVVAAVRASSGGVSVQIADDDTNDSTYSFSKTSDLLKGLSGGPAWCSFAVGGVQEGLFIAGKDGGVVMLETYNKKNPQVIAYNYDTPPLKSLAVRDNDVYDFTAFFVQQDGSVAEMDMELTVNQNFVAALVGTGVAVAAIAGGGAYYYQKKKRSSKAGKHDAPGGSKGSRRSRRSAGGSKGSRRSKRSVGGSKGSRRSQRNASV